MSVLFRRAIVSGGSLREFSEGGIAWTVMRWDVAGNCQSPHFVEVLARKELKRERTIVTTAKANATHRLELHVRCRTCATCLKAKAAHWRFRALSEYRLAPRTWLVTCTFTPEIQMRVLGQLRQRLSKNGVDFDGLPAPEKFDLRHRLIAKEITLFLKRLRKDAPFRYMLVAEEHKSGAPHYHLLVHEIVGRPPIRHAMFKQHYTAGFLDAKLVKDERQATYACKYLTKSQAARVRASLAYGVGNTPSGLVPPVIDGGNVLPSPVTRTKDQ